MVQNFLWTQTFYMIGNGKMVVKKRKTLCGQEWPSKEIKGKNENTENFQGTIHKLATIAVQTTKY